jgi:hypothetical protein
MIWEYLLIVAVAGLRTSTNTSYNKVTSQASTWTEVVRGRWTSEVDVWITTRAILTECTRFEITSESKERNQGRKERTYLAIQQSIAMMSFIFVI